MTASSLDQSEVVRFLSDPASYGEPGPVERINTHLAHVFLVGDAAYKIKRAVRYNYVDFSTLDLRRDVIFHELALNAPGAPQIYDKVVPITREASGALALGGAGEPVEYALKMRRFDREAELTNIADRGGLTVDLATDLGTAVAGFHDRAEGRGADGAALIGEIIEELREALGGMQATLGAARFAAWEQAADRAFAGVRGLLSARSRAGTVRRCHGDLHLKNLVMIGGALVPFDALEFDERLGTMDVLYDFAFLVMDLLHRGLAAQANAAFNAYLAATGEDEGLAALPLFLAIRAAIRSMVSVQSMGGNPAEEMAAEARAYLDEAIAYLAPPPARLIAIGGVSGTGKTSVARGLAPGLGAAPGAALLRSDVERKQMFGADPTTPLPPRAYTPEVSRAVYARLLKRAGAIAAAGHSAILDATFLSPAERADVRARAAALGAGFTGIWLEADPQVLEARVAARRGDASDADVAVLRQQLERHAAPDDWARVDAGGPVDAVVAAAAQALRKD